MKNNKNIMSKRPFDRITMAIIGCGNVVETIHLPVLLNMDVFNICFLYDKDPNKSSRLAQMFGLPHVTDLDDIVYQDIDCFLLAIPYGARDQWYELIAKNARNAYIFAEKPVVLCKKDVALFKDYGLCDRMFGGFMRRYYSNMNVLKKFVQNCGASKIKKIVVSEGFKTTATFLGVAHYRLSKNLAGGGILAETACHSLDQLTFLLPGFDYQVDKCSIVYDGDLDVHTEALVYAKNQNLTIPVECKFSALENLPNKISLVFDGFILESGLGPEDEVGMTFASGSSLVLEKNLQLAVTSYQAFYLEWQDVANSILHNKETGVSLNQTYKAGFLIESLYDYASRN